MAISYPVDMPTTIGISQVDFRSVSANAISQSPFTFSQQVQDWGGYSWQADITLPPMHREAAEEWVAFLISLRGVYGTFYLSDPLATGPMGTATAMNISGTEGGHSCTINSHNGTLLPGDWFSTPAYNLHKTVEPITITEGDMEIFPPLRDSFSNVDLSLSPAIGIFRLASNETSWSINEMNQYGITFGAIEAL